MGWLEREGHIKILPQLIVVTRAETVLYLVSPGLEEDEKKIVTKAINRLHTPAALLPIETNPGDVENGQTFWRASWPHGGEMKPTPIPLRYTDPNTGEALDVRKMVGLNN